MPIMSFDHQFYWLKVDI